MKNNIYLLLGFLIVFPYMLSAQSLKKCSAPKATITLIEDGKEVKFAGFSYGKAQTIKVSLVGGVEKIGHRLFVTSRHAKIEALGNGMYHITPVSRESVELIVDIETYESYQFYQMVTKGKKKKLKKVLVTYAPEKYMVGFELIKVR